MVTAFVLVNVKGNMINEVAEKTAEITGVRKVYSVTGEYDVIAIAQAKNNQALADIVTDRILRIEGVVKSKTVIAFRMYSRHDLESVLSIGVA